MNQRKRIFNYCAIYILGVFLLFGCLNPSYTQQIQASVPGLAYTMAVQTMVADPNLVNLVYTSTPTPTWTTSPTMVEITPSLEITQTLLAKELVEIQAPALDPTHQDTPPPSSTPLPSLTPIPTSTPTCSNSADFVRDITIPDGTRLLPGQNFTKIWLVKNTGTCAWKETYSIDNFSGEPMGMGSPQLLRRIINPGDFVEITVDLVAPKTEGSFQGYWSLQDDNGESLKNTNEELFFFWVIIDVRKKGIADILGLGGSGSSNGLGGCGEYG